MPSNYEDLNYEYEFETIQSLIDKIDRDIFLTEKVDINDFKELVKLFDVIDVKQISNMTEEYNTLRHGYYNAVDSLSDIQEGIDILEKAVDKFQVIEEALNMIGVDGGEINTYSIIKAKEKIEQGYDNMIGDFE